jgi:hypothetical protein
MSNMSLYSAEEKIRIIIMPDGSSSVEVLGVKGKRCLKMTEELEGELGSVKERKAKAEMQEKEVVVTAGKVQNIHKR